MSKNSTLLLLFLCCFGAFTFAQRGKNGAYTVTAVNVQVNAYTSVTANAVVNATSITVTNNSLTSAVLAAPLAQGDLIMIIQMQGATMDINATPATPVASGGWGGNYTISNGAMADFANLNTYRDEWGQVTAYNNAGKYEMVEVKSVTGSTTINLMCGLKNSYTTSGHVQVVRVPRFTNLTVNTACSVVPYAWDGAIGGVVAIEVNGNLTINGTGKISASGSGFRGGALDNTGYGPAPNASDIGKPGYSDIGEGAEKGEGIGGYATAEYTTLYSRYGMGSPANGGGGGNYRNAGGGGGSNIGSGTYTGYGVPNTTYAAIWSLEIAGMSASPSPGGGRGGYSLSISNQNEATLGPNQNAWGQDYRRVEGGLGGHPLLYDATRLFMGGGGGSGEQDGNQGGAGGKGGGIVCLTLYGSTSGTGTIEANGANGQNSNSAGLVAPAVSATKYGNDGAGGAGAGGYIAISNGSAIPGSITLSATGGTGGNQVLSFGNFATVEASGPGGGGAGGGVAFTSGAPVQNVAGGANGTTNSSHVSAFPPNGATAGASGVSSLPYSFFDITSPNVNICTNTSTTLTATVVGTLPAGATLTWYSTQFGSTVLGTGTTYTTPVLSATTTYYVGTCPGTFRIPVTVTVGAPTISGPPVITDASCSTGGSITGLTTSGGAGSNVITWNGNVSAGMDLSNAVAGNYTIVVTDAAGCTATAGPYTINSTSGPTVNTAGVVLTDESCLGNDGSISGITASGSGFTYSWNGGAYNTLDISGLTAGVYTLTVTDNLGCSVVTAPYTINQTAGPTIDQSLLAISSETCGNADGSILGITASGTGLTYDWNGNASATPTISGIVAGNYTLTVTDNTGCTATAGPFNVPAVSGPTLDLVNLVVADEHCSSADGSITGIQVSGGSGAISYDWNSGAYNTLDITGLTAGNYSLTVTDGNGCTATAGPFTVNNVNGPSIDDTQIALNDESCTGNDASITGIVANGNGLTYDWNGNTTPGVDLTGASAGNYTLTVTDAFGCSATSGPYTLNGAVVLIVDITNAVVTPTSCNANDGSITGIVVSGGVNPQINWSNGPQTTDNTGLSAGLYTINVTDAQNCQISEDFTIIQSTPPVIDATAVTDATCSQTNGSVDVTASGGTGTLNYSSDNGATFQTSNILGNLLPGNYTLVVEDQAGCQTTTTITVGDAPAPMIDQVTATDPSCGASDGSVVIAASSGSGTLNYSIDNGINFQNNSTFQNLGAGVYDIIVSDANGCQVTQQTTLSNQSGNPVNAGNDVTICAGSSVTLVGTNAQNYAWDNGVTNAVPFIPSTTTVYTVTGTDAFGCVSTDQVTVTVNPAPAIVIIPDVLTGCAPLTVNFQNATANSGDCLWQFSDGNTLSGPGNQSVTFNSGGCVDLTMTVMGLNGCQASQTFTDIVCVNGGPVASFTPTPAILYTGDTYSTMINHSLGAVNYVWDFGDGSATSNLTSPTHQFPDQVSANYIVTLNATDANGCTDQTTALVVVNEEVIYYVPNSFTPNADGFNDVFLPIFTSGFEESSYDLRIFNRWGEEVFSTTDFTEGWDGTYAGLEAKDGIYTWKIEFKYEANDGKKVEHGSVTLLR